MTQSAIGWTLQETFRAQTTPPGQFYKPLSSLLLTQHRRSRNINRSHDKRINHRSNRALREPFISSSLRKQKAGLTLSVGHTVQEDGSRQVSWGKKHPSGSECHDPAERPLKSSDVFVPTLMTLTWIATTHLKVTKMLQGPMCPYSWRTAFGANHRTALLPGGTLKQTNLDWTLKTSSAANIKLGINLLWYNIILLLNKYPWHDTLLFNSKLRHSTGVCNNLWLWLPGTVSK